MRGQSHQRAVARLITLGALIALLAACAPSTDSGQSGGEGGQQVRLSVWSWRTEDKAAYDRIFDKFEAAHPNITVEFKPYKNTEYNTILSTGLTKEGGPDVAQLRAYGLLQPLVEAGQLVELDGKVPGLDQFDKAALDGARGRKDSKVYGVPFATQTMQIFYNKKLFADHGVAVPTTWDQLIAAADKFKKAGIVPFATTGKDAWMLPIVHDTFAAPRYGGRAFEEKVLNGQANFTDPDYVESIKVVQELAPYFPDQVAGVAYTDSQVLFTSGKAAMFPGGSFELGFFNTQAPDLDLGVFSAPPPPGSVEQAALVPGWTDGSWGVNSRSAHQAEALELVKWMASKEFGQAFTDELKQISPVPGVTPSDPLLAQMAAAYQERPSSYVMLVNFRYGQPLGTDLLSEGLQQMLLGKADAEEVAQQVQKGLSQWFEPLR
jgi:raffinose/stachyose/melibiose transport system substrate-binding protein